MNKTILYQRNIPVKYSVDILVAGKSVGVDRVMCASLRVIPGCYVTGQACGVAAAVCVDDGTIAKDADISKIQAILG